MRLLYFAWVKDKAGIAAEEVAPPEGVATVAELIDWLKGRGPEFDVLKASLLGEGPAGGYAAAARQLGSTEGAVKVAVHRGLKALAAKIRDVG